MDSELVAKFSLAGRGAVIVGAGSGIGRQAAISFAQAGARLTLADANASGLDEVRKALRPWTTEVQSLQLDVRDRSGVRELAAQAAKGGSVDVWANVAGVVSACPIVELEEDELDRIVGVNLKGVYWGCSAAAKIMTAQRSGSIINISSSGADTTPPGLSAYVMTKAAVNALTKSLAREVGSAGVRANAIAPGYIETPMVAFRFLAADGSIDEEKRREIFAARAEHTALGRIGQPDDVALMMLYLASDASRFVTGQVLRVNGGMSMP